MHRRDGARIGSLGCTTETPRFKPRLQLTEAGARRYQIALVRPRNFEEGRRYPVLVYVYGGPNYQVVTARHHRFLLHQWFADHGFVVVLIDGRGTPGRGRAWERAIRGNFIQVPLEDQAQALQALGRRFPELDLRRVGILGWSFGGYFATMAVLKRPDLFHAAV